MSLDRRNLLKAGAALSLLATLPRNADAQTATAQPDKFKPVPGGWRQFQVITRLELKPEGRTQAWVPLPSVNESAWFQSNGSTWRTNGRGSLKRDPKYAAEMLHIEWPADEKTPVVEVVSNIATRDRAIDPAKAARMAPLSAAERRLYLEGTELIPTGGIVKATAAKIVGAAKSDEAKARAIYEWVVENTFRNAATRGCGIGDIAAMLKSGNLGGKCADLNALFVGLARAAGVPARDVYGIRVAPSRFGYRSLGANSETITKAQHCRAEIHLSGQGWVAVDPADVRKVALEEPPANLKIDDPAVMAARKTLFGAWEGNWLAYNFAHDVALPGSRGPKLGFLMYPQAETASLRLDCLDPDTFKYTITAKELTAV